MAQSIGISFPDSMAAALDRYCIEEKCGRSVAVQRLIYAALKDRKGPAYERMRVIYEAEQRIASAKKEG